ncbi:MAG: hypothetical protein D6726_10390, partial [Nitrospirae bacterium]
VDAEDGKLDNRVYIKKTVGDADIRLASFSYISYDLIKKGYYQFSPIVLDDKVYSDYASLLIPRAVGYSAGLLNYFFRGEIDFVPDEDTGSGYVIENNSDEEMDGVFELFYDNTDGNRERLWRGEYLIAPGGHSGNISFAFPSDASEPGKFMLVFRGRMGNEEGAVVGRKIPEGVIRKEPYLFLRVEGKDGDNKQIEAILTWKIGNGGRLIPSAMPRIKEDGQYRLPVLVDYNFIENPDGGSYIWNSYAFGSGLNSSLIKENPGNRWHWGLVYARDINNNIEVHIPEMTYMPDGAGGYRVVLFPGGGGVNIGGIDGEMLCYGKYHYLLDGTAVKRYNEGVWWDGDTNWTLVYKEPGGGGYVVDSSWDYTGEDVLTPGGKEVDEVPVVCNGEGHKKTIETGEKRHLRYLDPLAYLGKGKVFGVYVEEDLKGRTGEETVTERKEDTPLDTGDRECYVASVITKYGNGHWDTSKSTKWEYRAGDKTLFESAIDYSKVEDKELTLSNVFMDTWHFGLRYWSTPHDFYSYKHLYDRYSSEELRKGAEHRIYDYDYTEGGDVLGIIYSEEGIEEERKEERTDKEDFDNHGAAGYGYSPYTGSCTVEASGFGNDDLTKQSISSVNEIRRREKAYYLLIVSNGKEIKKQLEVSGRKEYTYVFNKTTEEELHRNKVDNYGEQPSLLPPLNSPYCPGLSGVRTRFRSVGKRVEEKRQVDVIQDLGSPSIFVDRKGEYVGYGYHAGVTVTTERASGENWHYMLDKVEGMAYRGESVPWEKDAPWSNEQITRDEGTKAFFVGAFDLTGGRSPENRYWSLPQKPVVNYRIINGEGNMGVGVKKIGVAGINPLGIGEIAYVEVNPNEDGVAVELSWTEDKEATGYVIFDGATPIRVVYGSGYLLRGFERDGSISGSMGNGSPLAFITHTVGVYNPE